MSITTAKDAQSAPDDAWSVAARRAEALRPLLKLSAVSEALAREVAAELGLTSRQVYNLLRNLRDGDGHASSLLRSAPGRREGTMMLSPGVEALMEEIIRTKYLNRQNIPIASLEREIARECRRHNLPEPSRSSIQRRVGQLDRGVADQRRKGTDAARRLKSTGKSPAINGPLRRLEIDHTPIDLLLVDAVDREEIGRAYLTLAIDKYSRAILGAVVTFEAPSALSVGLCLTQVVADKRPYLDALAQQVSWPMAGKPMELYLDNASEFHSKALTRGCQEHGIALEYRPPGRPHFGGTVERHIGTFMQMVHELPGTTFSNISERGTYPSSALAAMTLREFEQWLVLAIARYHGTFHRGIGMTPAAKWEEGLRLFGVPGVVTDTTGFLLDFLPLSMRSISREGFVIDHVHYFSNALKPWIANRDRLDRFELRRDPRDISHAWVRDPQTGELIELPARDLIEPVSLREHMSVIRRHRSDGKLSVDVSELDRINADMRKRKDEAVNKTKAQKRERDSSKLEPRKRMREMDPPDLDPKEPTAEPFNGLEQW